MAVVTLDIPAASRRTIERAAGSAERADEAIAKGLETAVVIGADVIAEGLVMGDYGLTMRHPGSGLAASVRGWMIDPAVPLAAVGVPADSPAAAYAGILERGGTIYPRRARALAVPVSEEAKRYTSPRDMPDLTYIPRKGRPPLLVRELKRRGHMTGFEVHWVLLASVIIPAFHWLTRGVADATRPMGGAMQDVLNEYARRW